MRRSESQTKPITNPNRRRRGGALLAVLWISAALAAVAFSMANTVRTETERTSTLQEGLRSYYLATGAIERMWLYIQWGPDYKNPDGSAKYFQPGIPRVIMDFPTGVAQVEIIPESAKLSLNNGRPEDLLRLMAALGIDPERARQIVMAIVDWRAGAPGGVSVFDQYYMTLSPSFRARHASFEQIEELLLVKGMTPDLFYGTLVRDAQGRLIPQAGLKECLSVYASDGAVDANNAQPAVLAAIGVPPEVISEILQRRQTMPFKTQADLTPFLQAAGPAAQRLTVGGNTIFTFRATGRLRTPNGQVSDMSRTVSAMLKFHQKRVNAPPIEVLRWYDY